MKLFWLIALWTLVNVKVSGQVNPDSSQVADWERFNRKHLSQWNMRWDYKNGSPGSVWGFKTKKDNKIKQRYGDRDIALDFFREYKKLFKIRDSVDQLVLANRNRHLGNYGL